MATRPVNHGNACSHGTDEFSRVLISLSKADIELSKAEASLGRLEAAWIKWAKTTIVELLIAVAYGISIIILSIKGRFGTTAAFL
jgi:hypothetical protein